MNERSLRREQVSERCLLPPKLYEGAVFSGGRCGRNVSIGQYSTVRDCDLGDNVSVQRFNALESSSLGAMSYTGRYTTILHSSIGSFTSISWGVSIGGANHDYGLVTTHSFTYSSAYGMVDQTSFDRYRSPCTIGNDVWIGTNAVIMRGVTVGDGAVIGAGAVVTHDAEPYSIVVGAPAKTIKLRYDEETIDRMLRLRWWEFPLEVIKENVHLFQGRPNDSLEGLERLRAELDSGKLQLS